MAISLLQAVKDGRYIQAKLLIEQGVSINSQNSHGSTPLLTALRIQDDQRRSRMFKWLLRMGADSTWIDASTNRDLLSWAAYYDRTDQVRWILDVDEGLVNVHHQDRHGRTAMHYATMHGNVEALYLLVIHAARYGLTVDIRDYDGLTPYLLATMSGYKECKRILVEFGHAVTSQIFITALDEDALSESSSSNIKPKRAPTHIGLPPLAKSMHVSEAPKSLTSSTSSLLSKSHTDMFKGTYRGPRGTTQLQSPNHSVHFADSTSASSARSVSSSFQENEFRTPKAPPLASKPQEKAQQVQKVTSLEAYISKYLDILSQQNSSNYRESAVVTLPLVNPTNPDDLPGQMSRQSSNLSFVGVARIHTMAASLKKKKIKKRNSKQ